MSYPEAEFRVKPPARPTPVWGFCVTSADSVFDNGTKNVLLTEDKRRAKREQRKAKRRSTRPSHVLALRAWLIKESDGRLSWLPRDKPST